MRSKKRAGAIHGFSNEKFLSLLTDIAGIVPVGVLGRDTTLDLSTPESALWTLLVRELFSKYDDGKPSSEKDAETWKRFHAAETACRLTNVRFRSANPNADPFWVGVRRRVWNVLGAFDWDECHSGMAFGPGATTRLPKAESAMAYKYSGKPECTSGNAALASCAIRMVPVWNHIVRSSGENPDDLVKIVKGNSVTVVPKNYKTGRTIAKEPDMNIYVQKGIGQMIRRRLRWRAGIDLDDQSRNQRAAYQGSVDGSLATIDLSMASDTVSFELVSFLLPNDWWYALEQSRSPVGVLPSGESLTYQKFSSMGNGYTFELESLIFWAICQQVASPWITEKDNRILVYGDDIVVPSDQAETVLSRLEEAGFTPNSKKTFITGPYRESCGKHYFQGYDITPFYVKKPVNTLDRLFLLHNNLKRWEKRTGIDRKELLTRVRALAPAKWREPRLPDGFGDGAFIGEIDELRLDPHPHGWEYWQVRVLVVSQKELQDDLPKGQLVASLLGGERASLVSPYVKGLYETNSRVPAKVGKPRTSMVLVPRHPTVL